MNCNFFNYLKYCKLLYSKFSMSQNKIFINLIEYSVHHKMFFVSVVHTVLTQTHTYICNRENLTYNATYNLIVFGWWRNGKMRVLVVQFARDALVSKVNRHHIVYVYFLTSSILHRSLCLIFGFSVHCLLSFRCGCVCSFVLSCISSSKSAHWATNRGEKESICAMVLTHFTLKTVQNSSRFSSIYIYIWEGDEEWKTKGRSVSHFRNARL